MCLRYSIAVQTVLLLLLNVLQTMAYSLQTGKCHVSGSNCTQGSSTIAHIVVFILPTRWSHMHLQVPT